MLHGSVENHEITDSCFLMTISDNAHRDGSDGSMSASGSAGPGFDPGVVVNFHLKMFNFGARIVHHRSGLNSKPFRTYFEKAHSTIDSDSSVGWGR